MPDVTGPIKGNGLVRWILGLAGVFLGFPSVSAQTMQFDNVSVYLIQEQREQFNHGYLEYRFRITNQDEAKPHRVTLSMPANGYNQPGYIQSLKRSVEVGPKSSAMLSLLQPCSPRINPSSNVSVDIDGKRQDDLFPLSNGSGKRMGIYGPGAGMGGVYYPAPGASGGSSDSDPLVLVSQKTSPAFLGLVELSFAGHFISPTTFPASSMGSSGGSPGMGSGARVPPRKSTLPGGSAPSTGLPSPVIISSIPSGVAGSLTSKMKSSRSPISVSQWSDNWLGYSAFDLILLTMEEIKELETGGPESRAILNALFRFTEAGGNLLVVGKGTFAWPRSWNKYKDEYLPGLIRFHAGFGTCFQSEFTEMEKVASRYQPKVGTESPDEISQNMAQSILDVIKERVLGTARPWQQTTTTTGLQNSFPVVDNLSVPIRGLLTLMILFAIVIGPVNFSILSRWNKRIWLLWTVPVISFAFCLAILSYNLLAEGWYTKTRTAGITVLDQLDGRATTLGFTGFYCPLSPGSLKFSALTELHISQDNHPALASNTILDWTEDQNLVRGWALARVPTYFSIRKSEDRRERVTFSEEGNTRVQAVNALGVDISELYYMNAQGKVFLAKNLAAGANGTLGSENEEFFTKDAMALQKFFALGSWSQGIKPEGNNPTMLSLKKSLRPGTYLAFTETNPFLENGIKGSSERQTPSAIYGIVVDGTTKP